jgi:hypothetical protein
MKLIRVNEKIEINPDQLVYVVDETKSAIVKPGDDPSKVGDGRPRTKLIFVSGLFVDVLMPLAEVKAIIEGSKEADGPRIEIS